MGVSAFGLRCWPGLVDIYQPVSSLVVVASKLKRKVPLCLIWDQADSLGDARAGGLGYSQIGHVRDVAKKRGRVEEGKPSAVTDGQPASLVGFLLMTRQTNKPAGRFPPPHTPNKAGRGEAGGRARALSASCDPACSIQSTTSPASAA